MSGTDPTPEGGRTRDTSSGGGSSGRKRWGCLRKFGVFLLVALPVLALLINGPVFRWLATYGIQKGAATQGLTGSASVRGNLISGFDLVDVEFAGDETSVIDRLAIGNAGVDYSVVELLRTGGLTWLNEVRLFDADVVVTLKENAESTADDDTEDDAPESDEPSVLWQLLETRYQLRNINVAVTRGDKLYKIDGFSLNLGRGGVGELSIDRLEIPGAEPREAIVTPIVATPTSLTLGPLELLDAVEVSELTLRQSSGDEPLLTAALGLSGGSIRASYARDGAINATLDQGEISLPELLALAQIEDMESGVIKALDVDFSGDFGAPATWDADLTLGLASLRWGPAKVDDIVLTAALDPGDGEDERLRLTARRNGASLEATADVGLAETQTVADLASLPLEVTAKLAVGAVEDVLVEYAPDSAEKIPATGSLDGDLHVKIADKKLLATNLDLRSSTLAYDGVPIDSITVDATLEKLERLVLDADVVLDENTSIAIDGTLNPDTLAYEATADIKAAVAGRLKDLLPKLGLEKELKADAQIAWKGDGNLKEKKHRGVAKVDAGGVSYAGADPIDAQLDGAYNGINIDLRRLSLKSEKLQFEGAMRYLDSVFELPEIRLSSGDLVLLQGKLKIPLDPGVFKEPVQFFTQQGTVDIDIQSSDLSLASLLGLIQKEAPVDCRLGLALKASGSPADLNLVGNFAADDIILIGKDVPPASVALDLAVSSGNSRINGRIEHPQIEPFVVDAAMPFTPAAWIEGARDPMAEPVTVTAKMAESQLGFLRSYAPVIESIDGAIDLDLALSGTLREPVLSGSGELRMPALAFDSPKAPSVREVEASLRLEKNAIHIDKMEAIVAGGRVGMRGNVAFQAGAPPVFDLQLGGHEVLVFRTDSLSIRTDANLHLKGDYAAATIGGTIGLTNSLFYKDVDLLPVGGPGKGGGKSEVPEVDPGPKVPLPKSIDVGVPMEPFNNWDIDVRLVTLDPFRVAGNLAQAEAYCDLTIRGKLEAPVPDGRIWVENGRVVLPFSKVELSEAEVKFDAATGFNGIVALRAGSDTGDYKVSIFAHNRMLDPKVVFTSIPPLPREDILTLLASGVTREQLTDGGGTAATKALIYYLKSLRNKEGKIDPDAPPSFAETLDERTNVSVGKVDPDTGEMGVDASIRLWRQSYVQFSLGLEGSYRGVLKYIFRYR